MRQIIHEFAQICARNLTFQEPIHEFGSFQVPGQEAIAELRPMFSGKHFIGSDMRSGKGVEVLLNLHQLGLANESVGSAILLDTLEHVEYPHRAIEEVYRVLKPHGIIIMSSVMKFPIHDFPDDYWRFTPSAFQSLVKQFSWSLVQSAGEEDLPHTVVAVASKGRLPNSVIATIEAEIEIWRLRWFHHTHQPTRFELFAKRLAPPIALDMYRHLRRKSE
jgi:SAM-dependent methyltransferase